MSGCLNLTFPVMRFSPLRYWGNLYRMFEETGNWTQDWARARSHPAGMLWDESLTPSDGLCAELLKASEENSCPSPAAHGRKSKETEALPYCLMESRSTRVKNFNSGQVWWLTLVIPALWEDKVGGSPEVGSSRTSWPTW